MSCILAVTTVLPVPVMIVKISSQQDSFPMFESVELCLTYKISGLIISIPMNKLLLLAPIPLLKISSLSAYHFLRSL